MSNRITKIASYKVVALTILSVIGYILIFHRDLQQDALIRLIPFLLFLTGIYFSLWIDINRVFDFQKNMNKTLDTISNNYKSDVQCNFIGNDDEALLYISQKMSNDRNLVQVWDTHVRTYDQHKEYREETYNTFENAINSFIKRHNNEFHLIAGHKIDKKYINAILSGTKNNPDQAYYRRLLEPWPLMNFAVLVYKDEQGERKEVLFGWGKHTQSTITEAVFMSEDNRLVNEFTSFLSILQKRKISEQVQTHNLIEPTPLSLKKKSLSFIEKWNPDTVRDKLLSSDGNAKIYIVITFFVPITHLLDIFDELLIGSNRHLVVIMMSPYEDKLLEYRYGNEDLELRSGMTWQIAKENILSQLRHLDNYKINKLEQLDEPQKGTLEIKTYNIMPTNVIYKIGEEFLVGGLLTRKTFDESPMFSIADKGHQLWKIYNGEIDLYLENSKPYNKSDKKNE